MDDLDRMFRCLMQVLSSSYPQYFSQPFEIAELYQNLIPYRHHRRDLRIETNQDYEVALCRLLSGERGYLLADDALGETMRSELSSSNPNTAIFRDFAASRVALGPNAQKRWQEMGGTDQIGARQPAESRETPVPAPPPPVSWSEGGPARAGTAAKGARATAAPPPSPASPAPAQAAGHASSSPAASDSSACRYCGGGLPEGRATMFCPHCGQNLRIQRCPACGTELEINWKFCITCGRGVAAS